MQNNVTIRTKKNPGCLIQILWFAFIGWWLGQAWMIVAWILMITIIGIPLSVMMLNKLPWIIALRNEPVRVRVTKRADGSLVEHEIDEGSGQYPAEGHLLYFVGWWLSASGWKQLMPCACR